MSSIYEQLSLMSNFFLIRHTEVTVNAGSIKQLLDYNNNRIYLALTYLNSSGPVNFVPFQPVNSNQGFPTQGTAIIWELWIEKHKSMVQQAWWCNNTSAALQTIECMEVIYQLPEGSTEGTMNEQTS